MTAMYIDPIMINKSCSLFLHKRYVCVSENVCVLSIDVAVHVKFRTYISFPFCQKSRPNITAEQIIDSKRAKLYAGLLQYDKCCFHRHATNCILVLCGKRVGKCKSLEPGCGSLNCLTNSMVSLRMKKTILGLELVLLYPIKMYIHYSLIKS